MDGSEPFHPMGEKPNGIILYTRDGYMSAQVARSGRRFFASGDWFNGTPEEVREGASGYIAYSGPFHTDEENQYRRTRCPCRCSQIGKATLSRAQ